MLSEDMEDSSYLERSHDGLTLPLAESKPDNDMTSSISSDIDTTVTGTRPNLTSSGRISPHRVRSLRDQETQLQELKKENFGLKLRIYHLEEALRKRYGESNEDWEMNIQLNVQVDEMKQEIADREMLLRDAKHALDTLESRIAELENELAEVTKTASEVPHLQDSLRRLHQELQQYQIKFEEAQQRAEEEELRAQQLEEEINELNRLLTETSTQKSVVPHKSFGVQTEDYFGNKLKILEEQLAQTMSELEDAQKTNELKDRKIQELELEILRATNKMAAMATEHAQQMQTLTDEINKLKATLEEKDELLRQRDREILEVNRQLRELQRQLREVTDTAEQLRNRLAAKEEECFEKDREMEDLRRKIRDFQDELERLRSQINGLERTVRDKDEEIENLKRRLQQKENELADLKAQLSQLRAELAEKDKALSAARTAAHSTNINAQEISSQVTQLTNEIEQLREQLKQETKLKNDAQSSLLAKDELIAQLRQAIEELQRKLTDTEETLLQATTAHAAEKGVLQSTIETLTKQLEQKEAAARNLRSEIAQLRGENEALRRELERLRQENGDLQAQVDDLEQQIKEKNILLEHSERTIDSLQRTLDELSQNQNQSSGVPTAEVAKLQARLKAQEHALQTKDSEIASLRQAVLTKDKIILDLQQELEKAQREKQELEETIITLNEEKDQLENYIRTLEEAAEHNTSAYEDAKRVMEQLQEQVLRLEAQIRELSRSPGKVSVSVETTPTKGATPTGADASPGSSTSTTMIIGAMSENLLLLILQKLEELYREMMAGRNEGSQASNSMSEKLDELAKLQKQFQLLSRKRGDKEDLNSTLQLLDTLQKENERLLHELEIERERVKAEGGNQSLVLKEQLAEARRKISELQGQCADRRRLQEELDRLRSEIARLQARLEAEEDANRRLRIEITELRLANLRRSTANDIGSTTSLPDLHVTGGDNWMATASSFTLGDRPDLSELIQKHREVTRLNQELQRKCEERLHVSPRSSRPASASQSVSYWQTRLKEQEQNLKQEIKEKERILNARLRRLEDELQISEEKKEALQHELTTALTASKNKEKELASLLVTLQSSRDKTRKLEEKLDQVLMEKNQRIQELEERISELQNTRGMYTPTADGELKTLRKSLATLRDEKSVLMTQLTNCRDQVAGLQRELELHQRLLQDSHVSGSGASQSNLSVDSLLAEIRALRRQLEDSLRNNVTLSDQLRKREVKKLENSSLESFSSPKLPTRHTSSTLRKSATSLNLSGSPPFVPIASSTVDTGVKTRPRITGLTSQSNALQLEARIQEALESPTCGGMDREFLQELLLYLQQQRLQLDDSQRLLDRLEQTQEIPTVSHITVSHGPPPPSTTENQYQDQEERSSSRASSVDLSLIHDQLRRTHAAVMESKNLLKKRHTQS